MTGAPSSPLERLDEGCCVLTLRVTPKGGRDQIDGAGADAAGRPFLRLRVSAPPEGGAANKAVLELLAKTLGLRKSALHLASGQTSRLKRVEIDAAVEDVQNALDKALS